MQQHEQRVVTDGEVQKEGKVRDMCERMKVLRGERTMCCDSQEVSMR
jgi:hypothetical protein